MGVFIFHTKVFTFRCRDKERQKCMIFKSPREAAAKELARQTKKSYFCRDNFNNQIKNIKHTDEFR